jgi:hypothetical protein
MSDRGSDARSQTTNGPCLRGEAAWIASAASSLPVPVSPWMSTTASLTAARDSSEKTCCMAGMALSSAPNRAGRTGVGSLRIGVVDTAAPPDAGTTRSSLRPMRTCAPGATSTASKRAPW